MSRRLIVFLAVAALAAACVQPDRSSARAPRRPNWMAGMPYLAQSQVLDTAGTADAEHVVILSPAPLDSVANFYRDRLPALGWRLMGDQHDAATVSLYLERAGSPLWIQIRAEGEKNSRVSFTAAAGAPKTPPPAAR
jgi:hypothetical protein